jgi:2'-5' RNA ligase
LRRVKPELFHVTLAFLGRIPDERLADVVAACAEAASARTSFSVTLDRAGRFPESGTPRVLWLGMGEGATESADLAADVRNALTVRGILFDEKAFRAHVTVARVKDELDRPSARAIVAATEALRLPSLRFMAEAIITFESVLSPKGPRYTPRAAASLGTAE